MEFARLSLEAPDEVSESMEVLHQLLEDRLAGEEIDFDAMLEASTDIDQRFG